jgi:hypothetical protein
MLALEGEDMPRCQPLFSSTPEFQTASDRLTGNWRNNGPEMLDETE